VGPFGVARLADRLPLLHAVTLSRPESIAPIAELGISMLMFMIGLELSLERLRVMRRLVFGLGLPQFVLCGVAIGAVARALGASMEMAAVAGAALSMSSTAPARLGARMAAMVAELRATLVPLEVAGHLIEVVETDALVAWRRR